MNVVRHRNHVLRRRNHVVRHHNHVVRHRNHVARHHNHVLECLETCCKQCVWLRATNNVFAHRLQTMRVDTLCKGSVWVHVQTMAPQSCCEASQSCCDAPQSCSGVFGDMLQTMCLAACYKRKKGPIYVLRITYYVLRIT